MKSAPVFAIAVAGIVMGLAMPAAARESRHLINGSSIKKETISGNRLKPNTLTGKQIKESTLGTVPAAKTAEALPQLVWHPVKLEDGWTDRGNPGDRPAAYAVDAQGIVHLRGDITGTTYMQPAFSLPASVAPSDLIINLPFIAYAGTVGNLLIQGGTAIPFAAAAGTKANVTSLTVLDGVSFDS